MKLICIGKNYLKHINELNSKKEDNPVIFLKPDTSIIQKNQPFFIPEFSDEIHYEIEIILKFNKVGKHIESKFSKKSDPMPINCDPCPGNKIARI